VRRLNTYIPEDQANCLCKNFSEIGLLNSLTDLCDPKSYFSAPVYDRFFSEIGYSLFLPAIRWLSSQGYDFGTAYHVASTVFVKVAVNPGQPILRPLDFLPAVFAAITARQSERDKTFIQVNASGSGHELIRLPYEIPPRRVWDIKSNRVIDFSFLTIEKIEENPLTNAWEVQFSRDSHRIPEFWAISHSWTDDMQAAETVVNGFQWPVPLPAGICLEHVRQELIRFGARYVWLDVLCLRQEAGPDHEEVRKQELKVDVPTIGNIYRTATTLIRYFNGLGCSFSDQNWDNSRHWLQRAWTLQEVRSEDVTYNGGMQPPINYLDTTGTFGGQKMTLRQAIAPIRELARHISKEGHGEIYRLVKEMRHRHSSHPLDKLTGLFYLLRTSLLPTYSKDTPVGVAWAQSFHVLPTQTKLQLFFDFPYPDDSGNWFPSWEQLLTWPDRNPALEHLTREVDLTVHDSTFPDCVHYGIDRHHLLYIRDVIMLPSVTIKNSRTPGEYTIKTSEIGSADGRTRLVAPKEISFLHVYLDQRPIEHGTYTLVTPKPSTSQNWVICEPFWDLVARPRSFCPGDCVGKLQGQIFRKVGVLRTDAVIWLGGPDSTLEKRSCLFV